MRLRWPPRHRHQGLLQGNIVKGKNVCVNGSLLTQAKEYKPSEEFVDNRWRNAWNAVYVAGGWRLVQPNWAAMQVQTKVGLGGHNVNCNCDGNQSGNFKCKNNGGHNGKANGNEMNDMLLVLTCDDAKARRNRLSTENFRTL